MMIVSGVNCKYLTKENRTGDVLYVKTQASCYSFRQIILGIAGAVHVHCGCEIGGGVLT